MGLGPWLFCGVPESLIRENPVSGWPRRLRKKRNSARVAINTAAANPPAIPPICAALSFDLDDPADVLGAGTTAPVPDGVVVAVVAVVETDVFDDEEDEDDDDEDNDEDDDADFDEDELILEAALEVQADVVGTRVTVGVM